MNVVPNKFQNAGAIGPGRVGHRRGGGGDVSSPDGILAPERWYVDG